MEPWASGRMGPRAAARVAALTAAPAFANSLGNDFACDDRLIIAGNEAIRSLETLPGTFTKPYRPNRHGRELGPWRPVTTYLAGGDPARGPTACRRAVGMIGGSCGTPFGLR